MSKSKRENRKAEKLRKKESKQKKVIKKQLVWLFLALVVTLFAYHNIYDNSYTEIDDYVYIIDNEPLMNLEVDVLFSEIIMQQYSPLAMVILGLEFNLFDSDPKLIRLMSVLFHLGCVVLVFFVFRRFTEDDLSAGVIALLFGIHPLQVESVAWLSASMKISIYSLFFLASIYSYLNYLQDRSKKRPLFIAFLWFVASCLCKEQAVVLPVVLMSIDYFFGRKELFSTSLIEKIPFFITSFIFGVVSIYSSRSIGESQFDFDFDIADRLLFVTYSLGMYMFKTLIPMDLSFNYTFPIEGQIPGYFFIFPFIVIALFYLLYCSFKKDKRWLAFGLLFFLINIGLTSVSNIMAVRKAIMADRYMYIPMIGLVFVVVHYAKAWKKNLSIDPRYVLIFIGILFASMSFKRVDVWQDDVTINSDVIEKERYSGAINPYLAPYYYNRGVQYKKRGQVKKALEDYENAIMSDPNMADAYLNRGNIAFANGENDKAMADYNKVLEIDDEHVLAYTARGGIFERKREYDKAIQDLSRAINLDPNYVTAYSNRALTYLSMNRYDKAIEDCTSILKKDPSRHDIVGLRGHIKSQKGDYSGALQDYTAAIALAPSFGSHYYNRSIVFNMTGDRSNASKDALKARELGEKIEQAYIDSFN